MYREVEGDLFDPVWGFDAIGHGVNLDGVMGSGIAPLFRKKSEPMYQAYRSKCLDGTLQAGDAMPWTLALDCQPWLIYNLATQIKQGPNAAYVYVAMGLMNMKQHAGRQFVREIGIPLIGCGIGGLEWPRVQYLCKQIFERDEEILLTVVHKK